MSASEKTFLMGNQVLAHAAHAAGAKIMFGYPITPASEILETWADFCQKDSSLQYLQNEDEMSAGFATIGACLAGTPAFTATAGPGNTLMQDAFSMAEALRIPTVAMIVQRGGLSTSTVIYSQEEVRLTCFGGNGEGFRLVYSTTGLQELFDYTLKAFRNAWLYRWPTFILADGYQGKMKGPVDLDTKPADTRAFQPLLKKGVNLRNCYNLEEEIGQVIVDYAEDYERARTELEEAEFYRTGKSDTLLLAHGIVAGAVREAVDALHAAGMPIGLFRPITLRPFPVRAAIRHLRGVQRVIVFESAVGQLAELFKIELYHHKLRVIEVHKPAVGFTPKEIVEDVMSLISKS